MSTNKSFSTETSERYSRALFEVAKEAGDLEKLETDIKSFKSLLENSTELKNFFNNPTQSIHNQNNIILIDEIFTPDCSRYCLEHDINNKDVDFFDKQFFRNYLREIGWQGTQINIREKIKNTLITRYQQVYNMIINA